MSSLSELLAKIATIPKEQLRPGIPTAERSAEMALIHQVISLDEIDKAKDRHPNKARIKRACHIRGTSFEMEFQVPNDGLHTVIASYSSKGLRITDNGNHVIIGDSVEELREYLLGLTENQKKAGAS